MGTAAFYLHDQPGALRVEVRGRLDVEAAREIAAALATARSMLNGRPLMIDLRRAETVEPSASSWLLAAAGTSVRFLVREGHVAALARAVSDRPVVFCEFPLPRWRRWGCALLRRLRPRCACALCQPERVWSV